MYTKRTIAVRAGVIAGIVCASLASVALAQTVKPNVTVVNTAANPVPVTGTLNVGNSVLPVNVQNSVVPVEVSNADPIPVSIAVDPATPDEILTLNNTLSISAGHTSGSCSFPIVPAGKRLIVEHASIITLQGQQTDTDSIRQVRLERHLANSQGFRNTYLVGHKLPAGTFAISQPMAIYAVAGDSFEITVFLEPAANALLFFDCGIAGRLIDAS